MRVYQVLGQVYQQSPGNAKGSDTGTDGRRGANPAQAQKAHRILVRTRSSLGRLCFLSGGARRRLASLPAPPLALPWRPSGQSPPVAAFWAWRRPAGFAWATLSHTELPRKSVDLAKMRSEGLGRCRRFFWLGVAFDAVGVAVLFTGVFANLLFYDMLLYLGSIIIFVSLLWWIFWYTGNIEALPEDPSRRTSPRAGEVRMHRSGSLCFSLTLRSVSNTFRRIHRRRRPRLLPRVLQTIRSLSSTDPGQLEGNSDAGSKELRTEPRALHLLELNSVSTYFTANLIKAQVLTLFEKLLSGVLTYSGSTDCLYRVL
ncbi:uncharacterized protein LOC131916124 [Peromyscus eremicus]|uniref:uncharacterized protein LOC131916124 n=1 Tax=Peromyscus eremicus TaxID=42410 RepID=UPI0027DE1145|nr:uncharacterized protein LOC131916124 [Peromyscus eremicus]